MELVEEDLTTYISEVDGKSTYRLRLEEDQFLEWFKYHSNKGLYSLRGLHVQTCRPSAYESRPEKPPGEIFPIEVSTFPELEIA